ncbi:MAG: cysteine desulfurase-like protein [Gemmatimonadetes bacterium]|nr:cysteine desulfurase-like protein [Gemmatimonadota bacterium]
MAAKSPRSVDEIRADFPALRRCHRNQPVAFFDGPGGTQVPQQVIDAMSDYLARHNANTHWAYPTSQETDRLIGEARLAVADLLGAGADEVAFGLNMTSLTFHLARGLVRGWDAGDEIVLTELEHHGNIAPWEAAAADRGLVVRRVPFRVDEGTLDVDQVIGAFGPRTRLVAIGWASNALGTVSDVGTVVAAAAGRGITTFVDAVHAVPHVLPDVRRLGCDFLACSAYKFYGPHLGILYGRAAALLAVEVPKVRPAPDTIPERIETGTQSHEAIVGCRAAIDFLAGLAQGADRRTALEAAYRILHERGTALQERLWRGLAALPGVALFGPPPAAPRTPTVAFVVKGIRSTDVAARLAEKGLFLSHGDFYAKTVVERLGLGPQGLVRAGCACYTTADEVDRLIAGVASLPS